MKNMGIKKPLTKNKNASSNYLLFYYIKINNKICIQDKRIMSKKKQTSITGFTDVKSHNRSGYVKKDGTKVKSTTVKGHKRKVIKF